MIEHNILVVNGIYNNFSEQHICMYTVTIGFGFVVVNQWAIVNQFSTCTASWVALQRRSNRRRCSSNNYSV